MEKILNQDKTLNRDKNNENCDCQYYMFFQHKECEFFPCHKTDKPEEFNCIFCYCPLYALGEDCGGAYKYTEDGTKDCTDCLIPHKKDACDKICEKQELIKKLAARKK